MGVDSDDDTGMAIRPVEGVPVEKIDGILQEMVGYNNKMSPYYMPRTSVEEVDGKQVLVIWCPAGINRPYSVPENVTAKNGSKEYFYIRSGTSSIIAKGEVLDELREQASRVPFDERGNPDIKVEDISTLLLREYLVKVGSKLANELYERPLSEILEQMDLYVGPSENRMLRNVAAIRTDGNIQPQPSMMVEKVSMEEGDIVMVRVEPSIFPPVRYKGRIWIRIGPRKGVANENDEHILMEKRRANVTSFDSSPCLNATMDDLDLQLFKHYYLPNAMSDDEIEEDRKEGRSIKVQLSSFGFYDTRYDCPTNAGMLFFAKNLRNVSST